MGAACLWLWLGRGCCWPVSTQSPSVPCQCRRVGRQWSLKDWFGKGGRAQRSVEAARPSPRSWESGRKGRSGPKGVGEQARQKFVGSAHEHVEKARNASRWMSIKGHLFRGMRERRREASHLTVGK
ncbi:hypothetical protein LY76DRAFT_511818 [Colletotrichum caudatum]|nr:hypothetical protein LY76DRAFT_511818 [Colletotrichum caudatum]